MTQSIMAKAQPAIKGYECRFAVHMPPPEQGMPDLHFIKEVAHTESGERIPTTRIISNFKRPFWVTRKGHQNHKSKKEWEDESKLIVGQCTQTELAKAAARALGEGWKRDVDLRSLSASPYLYGTDIPSTAIIKYNYGKRYENLNTRYSVAVFDTETDVLFGTNEIIMATITHKSRVHTAVVRWFLDGVADPERRIEEAMKIHLDEYIQKRGLVCTVEIVDSPVEAIRSCANVAHELKPDFFAMWNMDFDVSKMIEACEKEGVEMKDIFCDPSVPHAYRFFKYKQGKKQKVTASGKITPIKPAAQWHVVTCPASFTFIDAMCVFKQVRTGKPEEQSYSLDSILNKILGIRKLKFDDVFEEDYPSVRAGSLPWHQIMQRDFKIEYIIYNRFDCISVEVLDEKTKDLSLSLPVFAGVSDFAVFNSQPRRMAERLHFYVLEKFQKVIASTSGEMTEELDSDTYDLAGWIVTLPAHLVTEQGLKIIQEYPELATNIRSMVGD
jgi:hypothetical protein